MLSFHTTYTLPLYAAIEGLPESPKLHNSEKSLLDDDFSNSQE